MYNQNIISGENLYIEISGDAFKSESADDITGSGRGYASENLAP
jgi:hypothetical protein